MNVQEGPFQRFVAVSWGEGLQVRLFPYVTGVGGKVIFRLVPYADATIDIPAYDARDNAKLLTGSISEETYDASAFVSVPFASLDVLGGDSFGGFVFPFTNDAPMFEGPFYNSNGDLITSSNRPAVGIMQGASPQYLAYLPKWSTHNLESTISAVAEFDFFQISFTYQLLPVALTGSVILVADATDTPTTMAAALASALNLHADNDVLTASSSGAKLTVSPDRDGFPVSVTAFATAGFPQFTNAGTITSVAPSQSWSPGTFPSVISDIIQFTTPEPPP